MFATGSRLTSLLPHEAEGFTVSGKDEIYNQNTLYNYIDGGAELYLSYGFQEAVSRRYSKADQPDIVVDVFDMGTSEDAFGVFSHGREEVDDTFGQGSQYTQGLLLFWKDRYYVSILAHPVTPESKQAIFGIAKNINAAVPKEGALPQVLTLLPKEGLAEESVRYFHHHAWLNSHYFVADENILHINEKTDAVLARYGEKGKRSILLLVKYESDADAKRACDDFVKYYLPELSKKRALKMEDGGWTTFQLGANVLTVVFNAPEEAEALRLIEAVQKNLSGENGK